MKGFKVQRVKLKTHNTKISGSIHDQNSATGCKLSKGNQGVRDSFFRSETVLIVGICIILNMNTYSQNLTFTPVNEENFTSKADKRINLFSLTNENGVIAQVTNYGARLVSLWVQDKDGKFGDVVLGFSNSDEYLKKKNYYGATCGRFANRIARGSFILEGKTYELTKNNGDNHLHGGNVGFESVVWKVEKKANNSLTLSYLSRDLEEGYPGNLHVKITYILTNDNELVIRYEASTDKTTIINLTNHSFFNLKGEGMGDVMGHELEIYADHFTPLLEGSIPSGEISSLTGTPLDFRKHQSIGKRINEDHQQLEIGNGYDHNYVLRGANSDLKKAAMVVEPTSGRKVEVFTTEPGLQFYTANFLDGSDIGKMGKSYKKRGAFCLETQHYPDSPNHPNFPPTELKPEQLFVSKTIYKFSAE